MPRHKASQRKASTTTTLNDTVTSKDVETGSDIEQEFTCAACKEEEKHQRAVKFCIDCSQSLCQQCVDFHRRVRQIKDHKLVSLDNADVLKCANHIADSLHCPNHKNKRIELFCKDHDMMCCLTCATVKHRNCTNVSEVADLAAEINRVAETQKYSKHLESASGYVSKVMQLQDKNRRLLKSHMDTDLPKLVQDIKRKVNEVLNNLEQSIISRSSGLADIEFRKYDAGAEKWGTLLESITENVQLLETVRRNGSDVHFFIALENIKKKLKHIDMTISDHGSCMELARAITCAETFPLMGIYCETRRPDELASVSVKSATVQLPTYDYCLPDSKQDACYNRNHVEDSKQNVYNIKGVEDSKQNIYHNKATEVSEENCRIATEVKVFTTKCQSNVLYEPVESN